MQEITADWIWRTLPVRQKESNKGSYGIVAAAAGSLGYRGAAALCVEGALRGGTGLVFLAAPEPVLQIALTRTPECCAVPCAASPEGCARLEDAAAGFAPLADKGAVLLAGPGLGAGAGALLERLLEFHWRGAVLDADALNAMAAGRNFKLCPSTILTPHPGEMARLLGTDTAAVQANREKVAAAYAVKAGCTVILKGNGTIVAAPDGRTWHNPTGNAGLARGGSGDLLAGLVAALLAQGLNPVEAACCGAWLHGAAADACAARLGMQTMLPHDILADLGALFAKNGH